MDRRWFLKGLAAVLTTPAIPKLPLEVTNVIHDEIQYTGFSTPINEHLIRNNIWSAQLKEMLLDDLRSMKFVTTLGEGDGQS